MIEQLAAVIYGIFTLLIAVILASMQHSVVGMALAFAASGLTYLFQWLVIARPDFDKPIVLLGFPFLIWLVTILSALASTAGL
jgi:hypothetical protein